MKAKTVHLHHLHHGIWTLFSWDQQGTNVFSEYNTTVLDDSWLGKRYHLDPPCI